ncbi:ATP-binding protein [Cereibacter sp. SYSU M97828]|nr:ATP-binding protein [Cereibacter flavus]
MEPMRFRMPVELEAIDRLAPEVRAAAAAHLPEDRLVAVEIALVEALSNVVRHGHPAGEVEIELRPLARGIEVEIADVGNPIPPGLLEAEAPDDPLAESGRGLALIRTCADDLRYESSEGRNRLTLTFR